MPGRTAAGAIQLAVGDASPQAGLEILIRKPSACVWDKHPRAEAGTKRGSIMEADEGDISGEHLCNRRGKINTQGERSSILRERRPSQSVAPQSLVPWNLKEMSAVG